MNTETHVFLLNTCKLYNFQIGININMGILLYLHLLHIKGLVQCEKYICSVQPKSSQVNNETQGKIDMETSLSSSPTVTKEYYKGIYLKD